jgi:hypothetical protein
MSEPFQPAVARWAPVVREFEASGLTLRQFAALRGLNPSTLGWWRSRLRQQPPAFVEVSLPTPDQAKPALRVRPDGRPWVVEVDEGADPGQLRRLLEALC